MMNRAEVDKLLLIRAAEPRVLSLFLTVPLDPAALRGLPARADGLLAAAGQQSPHSQQGQVVPDRVLAADRQAVR